MANLDLYHWTDLPGSDTLLLQLPTTTPAGDTISRLTIGEPVWANTQDGKL